MGTYQSETQNTTSFHLRKWQITDVQSLAYHLNNKHIWDYCRDRLPYPYTEADASTFIEHAMQQKEQSEFCIEVRGEAVGNIGFVRAQDVERYNAEVGYWLAEKYWRLGITTDALKLAISQYLQHTDIVRLYATVFETNPASMRVLEKAGFKKACTLHKACFKNNCFLDVCYYELLKEEMQKSGSSSKG